MRYLILVENDDSKWDDRTGVIYHFPNKYIRLFEYGTKFIYYKSRTKNNRSSYLRLSKNPHYFGKGLIGKVFQDSNNKKNYYSEINDYLPFKTAVDFKKNGKYLEELAYERSNYFRDGVREITKREYDLILTGVDFDLIKDEEVKYAPDYEDLESREEGEKRKYYVSYYERNPINRQKAIEKLGLRCEVCKMRFDEVYGNLGKGFIHVHHKKPISKVNKSFRPDIEKDFAILCPNCHSMVHRPKDKTLSVEDLKRIYDSFNS